MAFRLALPDRARSPRRDRRERGLRGPLIPPMVARGRTPAARFHRHVAGALARLDRQWHRDLARIEVRVEDVPTSDPASWEVEGVPLARSFSRSSGQKDRIVLYRRPIEARACDPQELSLLVLDILVEQVATVLGRSPEEIDPGYGR